MTLEEKISILVADFGIEMILYQNDIDEETLLTELVRWGMVDVDDYFYKDMLITNNED